MRPPARAQVPAATEPEDGTRRRILIGVVVAALGGAAYLVFFSDSDEDEILELLERVAHAVRVDGNETNPAIRTLRLQGEFAEIFLPAVSVRIPELTSVSSGSRELAQVAAQAGSLWARATISLGRTHVEIDSTKTLARAEAIAKLDATEHGGARRIDERRVSFRLEKIDGSWRIAAITVSPKEPDEP